MPVGRVLAPILICLSLLAAAPAGAATLDLSSGTLRYTAAPGEANVVTIAPDVGYVTVTESTPTTLLTVAAPCTPTLPGVARCPATSVSRLSVDLGDLDDRLTSTSALATTAADGAGDDRVTLGAGADTLKAGTGADVLSGGAGTDTADYSARAADLTIALDDQPGDGEANEGDDVRADVENVTGGAGDDRLTGSAAANVLRGNEGDDTFDGGAGADTFAGNGGQDVADYRARTVALSLSDDGLANDGAAGENDNIGTDVDDLLAGSGDDTITGSTWTNTLRGGAGRDTLAGATGDDVLDGGPGADILQGGDGIDLADYSARTAPVSVDLERQTGAGEAGENDRVLDDVEGVTGGSAGDDLSGDGDGNRLYGGGGDDVLDGRGGADTLSGGAGWDVADYSARTSNVGVTLDDGSGDGAGGENDNARSDLEEVLGGAGDDRLTGDGDANVLRGAGGDDQLRGGGGNDQLDAGDGNDSAWGGAGDDAIALGRGTNKGYGEDGADTLSAGDSADELDGGSGGDTLTTAGGDDKLWGGDGGDVLDAGAGNDTADGQRGADRVLGGSGNDTLRGSDDADVLEGAAGNDSLDGGAGDDGLDAGDGNDRVFGQDGGDRLSTGDGDDQAWGGRGDDGLDLGDGDDKGYGEDGADTLAAGGGDDTLSGGSGDDTLSGGDGDNRLTGDDDGDRLSAGAGDDTLSGGSGDDALDAGAGDDKVNGDDGADRLAAGDGEDKLDGGNGADALDGGAADDTVSGGKDADRLQGGDGRDELGGGSGDDVLDGGAGADVLRGDDGEDTADYGARTTAVKVTNDGKADDGAEGEGDDVAGSTDRVIGGAGADDLRQTQDHPAQLDGGAGDDRLSGGGSDDVLRGGAGRDRLVGSGGRDRLDAGAGDDTLAAADGARDWLGCGAGKDAVTADRTDQRSGCEKTSFRTPKAGAKAPAAVSPAVAPVTALPAGRITGTKVLARRGRFVSVAGSRGVRVDSRLLSDVTYLKARYHIAITAGYALQGHEPHGEHPIGLGLDIVPGAGGSWEDIDRLARWAEPRQDHPRAPFRWVGYNGDAGHGRGDHLHLSWSHAPTPRGKPARWVRVLSFRGGRAVRPAGASLRPLAHRPNGGGHPHVRTGLSAAPRCQGAGQLVPTWKAAAKAFGLRWTVLAAITEIESGFGCNMGPSKAGALGWTQFMPATWKRWGMDADGDGKASPYSSVDAIFSTARYLRASGAPTSYKRAIFAYNHADWYVKSVLIRTRHFL